MKFELAIIFFLLTLATALLLQDREELETAVPLVRQEVASAEQVTPYTTPLVPPASPSSSTSPSGASLPTKADILENPSVLNSGPLQIHLQNPRYFTNDDGDTIYLTGSHHWDNLVDNETRADTFDYAAYLDFLEHYHHNHIRLWSQWAWLHPVEPSPYERLGPGQALDGELKYDLTMFNQAYFNRLRERVILAGERGFYVTVVLFQGWSIQDNGRGNPWVNHPYQADNNINGVDGDLNENGAGEEIHTLANGEILALQEAYVQKVLDTLNDLDNVMYEISNESHENSMAWQNHMVHFIRAYERTKAEQHLIGMSGGGRNKIANDALFASPADWVSPSHQGGYRNNPPVADGHKVVIADTDHIFGIGGDGRWVWQSFMRGLHPIYMDDFGPELWKEEARIAMGQTLTFAQAVNLVEMRPLNDLASTRFCLASPTSEKAEYLVYLPKGDSVNVNLTTTPGVWVVQWFNPETGQHVGGGVVVGGEQRLFSSPFAGQAVLYLKLVMSAARPLPIPGFEIGD